MISPMSTPEHENASPTVLAGLATLAATLGDAAGLPGLLVYVTDAFSDNACAEVRPCGAPLRVGIAADLLADGRQMSLYGALAHEIAHHALGHPAGWLVPALERITIWAMVAAGAATSLAAPAWVVAVLAVLAVVAFLVSAWRRRADEYAADAHAAALLEAVGLPGAVIVAASLADEITAEPRWYALGGWLLGGHPATGARLHRLSDSMPLHPLAPKASGGPR
ncbi:M48 family metalloprotease [Streptosporangium sp. NPDC048047]|uniref:M48 family metalloprotease n=1 Tax=Streptosporangium sp. NPDC048047 TaxID=3155748 RepID=UPI0034487C00